MVDVSDVNHCSCGFQWLGWPDDCPRCTLKNAKNPQYKPKTKLQNLRDAIRKAGIGASWAHIKVFTDLASDAARLYLDALVNGNEVEVFRDHSVSEKEYQSCGTQWRSPLNTEETGRWVLRVRDMKLRY